ncbi:MAG: M3 family oligoendopeptidase [Acidimicrobiales bacterium]
MAITELPRWDVSAFFPGLDSPEFAAAHEALAESVTTVARLYDDHGVRGGDPLPVDSKTVESFETVIGATNRVLDQLRLLDAYVQAFVTTDAHDARAAGLASQLDVLAARVRTLTTRFEAWIGALGAGDLTSHSVVATDHAWPLQKAERSAIHQMSEGEESLYASLALTGSTAWRQLHSDLTALLTAEVTWSDGSAETLPISIVRGLATDPDPGRRRAAYEAELAAWPRLEVPLAAAMNAIKGEANTVNGRRAWPDSLAPALHLNSVDRETLDVMQAAVAASLPDWRRYLRAKAALLGSGGKNSGLPWWDLLAPVGDPGATVVGWDEARAEVVRSFGMYSPALASVAERAFRERWVDAEPRTGKQGGAFCMSIREGESRVFLNFAGSFDSVSSLAHELGHAYHNVNLGTRTPLQRATPMALAETASIFCETLLVQAGLATAAAEGDNGRRLMLLGHDLDTAVQVVVDIHSRFLFERSVYERRAERVLSPEELCQLMLDAQEAAYGDGLDEHRHAYMWAVKPHYYSRAYYNWPYTFGLLFGIGLYSHYTEDPERFRATYDAMLSSTGLADAAGLANRFGIDVHDGRFWTSSLGVLRRRVDEFCQLATPGP